MTTLKASNRLRKELGIQLRIIVLNGAYSQRATFKIEGFTNLRDDPTLVFTKNNKITIRERDFFICTFWTTAYAL